MTSNDIKWHVHNQSFWLLPEKAAFWESEGVLLVADLHFGKVSHFQRQGIAVPRGAQRKTLDRLDDVIARTQPKAIWFLGDLFHSHPNEEWFEFQEWMRAHESLEHILVQGNHDIAKPTLYTSLGLAVHSSLLRHGLYFSHEPSDSFPKPSKPVTEQHPEALYRICGHIHPGVKLRTTGRQSMTLPCFFETNDHLVLPAFGEFTGLHCLPVPNDSEAYIVTEERLVLHSSLPSQSRSATR